MRFNKEGPAWLKNVLWCSETLVRNLQIFRRSQTLQVAILTNANSATLLVIASKLEKDFCQFQ